MYLYCNNTWIGGRRLVYFIYGPDPYIRDVEMKKIVKDSLLVNTAYSFTTECIDVLEDVSLFGRRLLLLKFDTLGAEEVLFNYLSKRFPIDSDLIIMAVAYRNKTKLLKLLRKNAKVIPCPKLDREKLVKYCISSFRTLHSEITEEALEALIDRSGYLMDDDINLYKINIYLKQLSYRSKSIVLSDVELLVPRYPGDKAFELLSLILNRKQKEVFELTTRLLESDDSSPILIFGLMLRNIRIAYKVSLFRDENDKKLGQLLGLSYYMMRQIEEVRQVPEDKLLLLIGLLQKGTNDIKDGLIPASDSFIQTIGKMCVLTEK